MFAMIEKLIVPAVCLSLMLTAVAADPGEADAAEPPDAWADIVTAFRRGDRVAAFQKAKASEHLADPRIICFLGDCYRVGAGTAKDGSAALRYYEKVAEDISYARFMIGWLYATGNGVAVDKEKARELMDDAIANGMGIDAETHASIIALLRTPLTRYRDAGMGVTFPEKSGDMTLESRTLFIPAKTLGYGLKYNGPRGYLDLYIYDGGHADLADGLPPQAVAELENAFKEIAFLTQRGAYRNVRSRSGVRRGTLTRSKLSFAWEGFVYDPDKTAAGARSYLLIFCSRKHFLKIRYTHTKPDAAVTPERLPLPLAEFLDRLDAALTAR